MNVLVSGSSGLVGRAVVDDLMRRGMRVRRLVRTARRRRPPEAPLGTTCYWNPPQGPVQQAGLEHLDAVIHLAGEPIADGRWTDARKARIVSSRVDGTQLLCDHLANCRHRPKVLLCASAIGIYGDRGDERITEDSMPGGGFLADTARDWEAATRPAIDAGIRVINLRLGMVLSPYGGVLARLAPAFRLGLGGRFGNGRQYMSWISIGDTVAAIAHLLDRPEAAGPYNLTSPNPCTNDEFVAALGRVLHRPTCLDVPMFLVRAVFGEMADQLILASQRVVPGRLLADGFRFGDPELEPTLYRLLAPGP